MNSFDMFGYIEYKKLRLKAKRAGKTWDNSEESIEKLEDEINSLEKEVVKKEDKTANKVKVELSDKEVLEKRIENIEKLLNNDKFLSKVGDKVINLKKEELEELKNELKELT